MVGALSMGAFAITAILTAWIDPVSLARPRLPDPFRCPDMVDMGIARPGVGP